MRMVVVVAQALSLVRFASMRRATRLAFALLAAAGLGSVSGEAHAEPPSTKSTPVYVLSIETEDSDDPAEALTQALRSRVRQSQGWSLLETGQSLETLAIALKCPARPDAGCLQRIADQLHADHYVWGTMAKKRGAGEVTADMHLWSRGSGDTDASESYSENLSDTGDESLHQIASRLFAKLTGMSAGGTLVVHAGTGGGSVTVDGVSRATLDGGVARVDVAVGTHRVGVRVAGFDAPAQQTSMSLGAEREVTFALTPAPDATPEVASGSLFSTRAIATYSVVVGAAAVVAGGIEGVVWLSDSNAGKNDRKNVPANVTDVCATEVNASAVDACRRSKNAVAVSTVGWIFAGVGAALVGTGVVLMLGEHGSSDARKGATDARAKPRVELLPWLGAREGAVDLRVTF
jgi:hypothetical protein